MAASLCLHVPQTLPPELTKLLSASSPEDAETAFNAVTEWLALPVASCGDVALTPASSGSSAVACRSTPPGGAASSSPLKKANTETGAWGAEGTDERDLGKEDCCSPGTSILATRVYLLYDFLLKHVECSPAVASVACDCLACILEASSVVLWEAQRDFQRAQSENEAAQQGRFSADYLSSCPSFPCHDAGKGDPFLLLLSCASSPSHGDSLKSAMSSAPHCFYPPPSFPSLLGVTAPLPLQTDSHLLPACCSVTCSSSFRPPVGPTCPSCSSGSSRSSVSHSSCFGSPPTQASSICLPVFPLCRALCRRAKPKELFVGLCGCLAPSSRILPSLRLLLLPTLAYCCGAIGRRRAHFVVQAASLVLHVTVKKASRALHLDLDRLAGRGTEAARGGFWDEDELHGPSAWIQTFRRLYPPAARAFVFPEADREEEAAEIQTRKRGTPPSSLSFSLGSLAVTPDAASEGRAASLLPALSPLPAHVTLCGLVAFVRCLCVALAAADLRERGVETQRMGGEQPGDEEPGNDPRKGVAPLTILAATLRILELFTPMTPDIQLVELRTSNSPLSSPGSPSCPRRNPALCSDVDGWAAAMEGNREAFYEARDRVWKHATSSDSSVASLRSSRRLVPPLPSLLSCLQSLVWCAAVLHERHRGGLLPSLTGLLNTTAIPSPNQGDLEISPFSLAFFSYLLLALRLCGSAALPSPISSLSRASMAFRASFLLLAYANPHTSASLDAFSTVTKPANTTAKKSEEEGPCHDDKHTDAGESMRVAALAAVQTSGLPERHMWLVERKAEQLCLIATDLLSVRKQHESPKRFLSLCGGFSPFSYWKLLLALMTSGGTAASTVLVAQPLRMRRLKPDRPGQREQGRHKDADEDDCEEASRAMCLRALQGRPCGTESGERDPEDVQILFECFSQASQVYDEATQEDLFLSLIRKPPPLPDAAVGAILILLKRRWTASVLRVSRGEAPASEDTKTEVHVDNTGKQCMRKDEADRAASISPASDASTIRDKEPRRNVGSHSSLSSSSPTPTWVACLDSVAQAENAEMLWRVMTTTLVEEAEGTVVENSERLTTALNWLKLCLYTPEKAATPPSRGVDAACDSEDKKLFRGPFEQFGDALLARGQGTLLRALEKLTTRVDIELSILRNRGEDHATRRPTSTNECAYRQSLLPSLAPNLLPAIGSSSGVACDKLELLVPASRGAASAGSSQGERTPKTRKASVDENLKLALVQAVLSDVRGALHARAERTQQKRERAKYREDVPDARETDNRREQPPA
ncbi:conserved hypothetical protein [Neospora caninum Liverpool]|uniref:Uncharacterized protein n=1 Tax=Neospora caninum (strain Liverpool) TaxID=572307 RepID=F0VJP3_NEOCL|nr:conserved hypothetical protein [Neospora caninum Liverpool]CBZ53954.1 conserved hypothetical protein [Neospora caninum Liverpool]CEL67954.1 TPA: hypothetical protein BN1204_037360 [Neospora caninum Liverpool]|eukprot:XP_003883986.1 conserved hypothetical protein [Neospora caninum Liverpool]